jgi:hypothetical protein
MCSLLPNRPVGELYADLLKTLNAAERQDQHQDGEPAGGKHEQTHRPEARTPM